jgi:hypothetical protein
MMDAGQRRLPQPKPGERRGSGQGMMKQLKRGRGFSGSASGDSNADPRPTRAFSLHASSCQRSRMALC